MNIPNKRQCKRKFDKIEHLHESVSQYTETSVNIITYSHNSRGIKYNITLNEDLELCCTCGVKYNDPNRKNCRHISLLLLQLYRNYANSMTSKKKKSNINTQLQSLISQFDNLLSST